MREYARKEQRRRLKLNVPTSFRSPVRIAEFRRVGPKKQVEGTMRLNARLSIVGLPEQRDPGEHPRQLYGPSGTGRG